MLPSLLNITEAETHDKDWKRIYMRHPIPICIQLTIQSLTSITYFNILNAHEGPLPVRDVKYCSLSARVL